MPSSPGAARPGSACCCAWAIGGLGGNMITGLIVPNSVQTKQSGRLRLRGAAAAAVMALLGGSQAARGAGDVATWRSADSGPWTAGSAWYHSNSFAAGTFPNNTASIQYDVQIGQGGPTLDSAVNISSLTFGGGTISG